MFEEFERLGNAKETFDIVIADPPPFVKSRKDLEPGAKALSKSSRVWAQSWPVAPNGFLLLASCSHNISPERFAQECALGILRSDRRARLIHQAGAGADHPVHPMLPESAYLKTACVRARLGRGQADTLCPGCGHDADLPTAEIRHGFYRIADHQRVARRIRKTRAMRKGPRHSGRRSSRS